MWYDFLFPSRKRAKKRRAEIHDLDWKIQALRVKMQLLEQIAKLPMDNNAPILQEAANTRIELTILRRKMVHLLEWED